MSSPLCADRCEVISSKGGAYLFIEIGTSAPFVGISKNSEQCDSYAAVDGITANKIKEAFLAEAYKC